MSKNPLPNFCSKTPSWVACLREPDLDPSSLQLPTLHVDQHVQHSIAAYVLQSNPWHMVYYIGVDVWLMWHVFAVDGTRHIRYYSTVVPCVHITVNILCNYRWCHCRSYTALTCIGQIYHRFVLQVAVDRKANVSHRFYLRSNISLSVIPCTFMGTNRTRVQY